VLAFSQRAIYGDEKIPFDEGSPFAEIALTCGGFYIRLAA
jgi:hypothetical protein